MGYEAVISIRDTCNTKCNSYYVFISLLGIISTADPKEAFHNIDVAILVGAMPRKEGMERKDLLKANAKIFVEQGKALEEVAKKTVKVSCMPEIVENHCLLRFLMQDGIHQIW